MTKDDDKTFLKITNKDIWETLKEIKDVQSCFVKKNELQHEQIISRLDITNGRVGMNRKFIYALSGATFTSFLFVLKMLL